MVLPVAEPGSTSAECRNVVVVGDPGDPLLAPLGSRDDARFVVANTAPELAAAAATADVVLAWWTTRELLDIVLTNASASRLRWVHSIATGIDRIASPVLVAHPSILTNTRDVFSPALAEFVALGMLFFAKNAPRLLRSRDARSWDPFEVETLHGKTLGLIGFGSIGRATARIGIAFGMKVLVHRRHSSAAALEPSEIEIASHKNDLLTRADYVVLAAPLTPETRHLVGAPELALMKSSAVLVNVGRGALVDEEALVDALRRHTLRGAALDVFESEPLRPDHPFFGMDHVLLSPHCADRTATWQREALDLFFENLGRFQAGKPLLHIVNKRLGY